MSKENQYNTPEDLSHEDPHPKVSADAARDFAGPERGVFPGVLLGTWVNANPATRGLVRIELSISAGKFMVHPYGACQPTPCDWGRQPGNAYSANVQSNVPVAFSAHFPVSFKDTIVTGQIDRSLLIVETYSHFKDGSNRSDYYSREVFRRG